MNVGIYCPKWIISKHNTDHKVVKDFLELDKFTNANTSLIAGKQFTYGFNINKISKKLLGIEFESLVKYSLSNNAQKSDIIYHYGNPDNSEKFFNFFFDRPTVITSGFMTDRYINKMLKTKLDRQKEADDLAASLEKSSIIHFHTEGGRNRFLEYRPEFKEKTISIPFFLPNLPLFSLDRSNELGKIKILFVGNDGKRKGLYNLIESFELIGKSYLEYYNVEITIVSKDKVYSKAGINWIWFEKLPHSEIINLMKNASIFVLVPERESYGIVLVEAMMARCAIITDDDDTRKEIVGDSGILLNNDSPFEIANKLKLLTEESSLRNSLGEKAHNRALNLYHPDVVAMQYSNLFEKIS
jgi:glycosyltransferase involved in cell wall biosynthesis